MKKSLILVGILLINCAVQLGISTPPIPRPKPTTQQINIAKELSAPASNANYAGTNIDRDIQEQSHILLKRTVTDYHAIDGLVIAMDADSGEIRTLTTVGAPPTIAVTAWQPGSVIKPLMLAAALNSGTVNPTSTYFESGSAEVQHRLYTNVTGQHGITNVQAVITQSVNTGAIYLLKSLGGGSLNSTARTKWYQYLTNNFRFGTTTKSRLPDEQAGFIRNPNGGQLLDQQYAGSAFGVGMAVTPMQLLAAYAALSTDGTYKNPHIDMQTQSKPQSIVVSKKTSMQIQKILETSYTANYGNNKINGCDIGGKSGTAPVATDDDTYKPNVDNGSFIGYAHCGTHTIELLIRIDQPQTTNYASHIALIPWKAIMAKLTAGYANDR